MKLRIESRLDLFEKIHFYQEGQFIASTFNKIYVNLNGNKQLVKLPTSQLQKVFGLSRYLRRLLRLDICHVLVTKDQLVIVREGIVYNYDLSSRVLTKTLKLKQCKNILHQSMCKTPDNRLYFGEYGNNPERDPVNVYMSKDHGKSWEVVYTFPKGSIRHVHGCYYDKYTDKIWTLTGDYENENIIQFSNQDFTKIEILGDRSQKFRAVNVFFTEKEVHWIMDSPIEKSYQFVYDRASKTVRKLNLFNGPVWYLKSLSDGLFLAGSSVEKGEGVLSNDACLYVSNDLKNWEVLDKFQKDFLPMPYFKWGVLAFSNGQQSSKGFTLHFEGLKKVDGKSFLCSIS